MANVYTVQMLEMTYNPSAGSTVSAPVPAGNVWVVRSITLCNFATPVQQMTGIQVVRSSNFAVIFQVQAWECRPRKTYFWDGHHVLSAGNTITVQTLDATAWTASIAGYQLTLP